MDKNTIGREQAETLALQVLAWVLGQPDLQGAFLANSGAAPQDLPRLAGTALFQGAVLDFLMEEDARVLAFAADVGIDPSLPMTLRAALPGAQYRHWT